MNGNVTRSVPNVPITIFSSIELISVMRGQECNVEIIVKLTQVFRRMRQLNNEARFRLRSKLCLYSITGDLGVVSKPSVNIVYLIIMVPSDNELIGGYF